MDVDIWLFAHLDVAGGVTYSSDQVLASFRLRDTGTDLMQGIHLSIYPDICYPASELLFEW